MDKHLYHGWSNRIGTVYPVVGDVFMNADGNSNIGQWKITAISGTTATFQLISYVSAKGAKGDTGASGTADTTFTEAATLTKLASGESFKAMLGKIAKAVSTIFDKFDKKNIVNNQTTTVAGFALDARQANPNIDGTLAKQLSDLNGSLERQEEKSCVLVNATGSASYIRNGFMVQVIMEITPTKLENGAILLKGLPRPQKYIYMTLPAINGNNIPCTLNANGELAIYFQDGGNSISRIDHIFCYMWI